MTRPRIDFSREEFAAHCRRHGIRRVAFFGSVLRDDFTVGIARRARSAASDLPSILARDHLHVDCDVVFKTATLKVPELVATLAARLPPEERWAGAGESHGSLWSPWPKDRTARLFPCAKDASQRSNSLADCASCSATAARHTSCGAFVGTPNSSAKSTTADSSVG
jgi:hypothetical protein